MNSNSQGHNPVLLSFIAPCGRFLAETTCLLSPNQNLSIYTAELQVPIKHPVSRKHKPSFLNQCLRQHYLNSEYMRIIQSTASFVTSRLLLNPSSLKILFVQPLEITILPT